MALYETTHPVVKDKENPQQNRQVKNPKNKKIQPAKKQKNPR